MGAYDTLNAYPAINQSSSTIWHASVASYQCKAFQEVEVPLTPHWHLTLNLGKKENLSPQKIAHEWTWQPLIHFQPPDK
jgi:hypothetical protein